MKLTVAICTWNRCDLLRQTLEQFTHVVIPAGLIVEIVVVNNNSTDDTDRVIEEFACRLPLRRVFEARPGLSHARNAAIEVCSGDYLAFTDDDVLVDPSWLIEFELAVRDFPEAAACGGIIEPWFPEPPDPALMQAFPSLENGFCGLDHKRDPGPLPESLYVWGANMAYRRSWLAAIKFDPDRGPSPTRAACGDETDLQRRLREAGGVIVWWPNMRVRHYVAPFRMTLEYLLNFSAGKGAEFVNEEAASDIPRVFGVPRHLVLDYAIFRFRQLLSLVVPREPLPVPKLFSGPFDAEASARVRELSWRRELAFIRGAMAAHRARQAGRRATTERVQPRT